MAFGTDNSSHSARRLAAMASLTAFLAMFWQVSGQALASSAQDAPDLCVDAARSAAEQTGVPLPVLLALTLTETGRATKSGMRPWPWAVNQAGEGHWFATPDEAVLFAEQQLDLGLRNFDVGCFQLNHRWHSKGFSSTINMFDPTSNALYAAKFLAGIYDEIGDWSLAAATYHSSTPELAERYRAKFDAILAGLGENPAPLSREVARAPRTNSFPLLQIGARGNAASLVPLVSAGLPLFGGNP